MERIEADFNCRHAKVYCDLLVLFGLVPGERLNVAVVGRLQNLLDDVKLASVEPGRSHMGGGMLVHEAERLEDASSASVCTSASQVA